MVLVVWLRNRSESFRKWMGGMHWNASVSRRRTNQMRDFCCTVGGVIGARLTQNQELPQLSSTSGDLHGSDLILIDWSSSKPLNLTSATFCTHSTHLDLKLHFKAAIWWFRLKFFSYFESICICKSFCMAASVCLNIHILKQIRSAGCTVLCVRGKYHVFSAREQFIVNDFK